MPVVARRRFGARLQRLAAALWPTGLAVLLAAQGGCGRTPALVPADADRLVVLAESGPNSLDIHGLGANRATYGLSWNAYDRLLTFGSRLLPDGSRVCDQTQLEGELAESWEQSENGLTATFHLRPDASFHDGSPVTAADVKWSFDRAIAMTGFPAFQMKIGGLESPDQIEVVDDRIVRLHYRERDKLCLPNLATPVCAVYNARLAKRHATTDDPWAALWLKSHTAGGGAYRVTSWKPGQEVVFERFENWKSGPFPEIRQIIQRDVPSPAVQMALLQRGDADLLFGLMPREFRVLESTGAAHMCGHPISNGMWYLGMNVRQPPFDRVEVRQAIACAIPYQAIMEAAVYGRGVLLAESNPASPLNSNWPQATAYRTELDRARRLLAEAGYPQGFTTTLSLDQGTSQIGEPAALLIQEYLGKAGIRVTLDKVPGAAWRAALLKKDRPLLLNFFSGWLDYPDYFFYWAYHGQNAVFNTMAYGNQAVDRLVEEARRETDRAKYEAALRESIRIVFDEVPRVPLFQPSLDVAMRPGVEGYQFWFHRQLDLRQLSKRADPAPPVSIVQHSANRIP